MSDFTLTDAFANLKPKSFKKGIVILSKGQISRSVYYVTKGCLRSYVTDKAGKEHILQFAPEGWYISDMDGTLNNSKAVITIDTIEDSEVIVFSKSFMALKNTLSNEVLIRMVNMLQNNIIASNKRLIHLLSSTAEERYLDFVSKYPSLVQRLPLKLIAQYLGITPEYVSRIRKRIVHK